MKLAASSNASSLSRAIRQTLITCAAAVLLVPLATAHAAATTKPPSIDRETLDKWTAPYRGWHYQPEHVIPAQPNIPSYEKFHNTDVPCVYQLLGLITSKPLHGE